ncbi:MAG: hypothetical protein Q8O62_09855 [Aequorivita sp.]|nr:hypothetical protein [Aequorivita sp.]
MQLSKNFQLSEFASGSVTPGVQVNLVLLARQLQFLRDYFNAPVKIVLGISTKSPEHQSGKAAIISVSGKSADQIKAAFENLISQGAVYNGTIWLLNGNQVYYSLSPSAGRMDKRTSGNGGTSAGNGGGTTEGPTLPATTQVDANKKALMMGGLFLALLVVGMLAFKKDKKKSS